MNETRVKKLASEGSVEFTRKIFRRILRENDDLNSLAFAISNGTVDGEDVFAEPDFTFSIRLESPRPHRRLVCVQTPDGKYVRVVGVLESYGKET